MERKTLSTECCFFFFFKSLPNSQREALLSGGEGNFASPGSSRQGARREESVRARVCAGERGWGGKERGGEEMLPLTGAVWSAGARRGGLAASGGAELRVLREGSPSRACCSLDSEPAEERTQGSVILGACPGPGPAGPAPPHSTRPAPLTGPLAFPRPESWWKRGVRPALLANGEARQWLAGPRALSEFVPAGIGRPPKLSWKGEWDGLTQGKQRSANIASFISRPFLLIGKPTGSNSLPQLIAYLFMESNDALKLYGTNDNLGLWTHLDVCCVDVTTCFDNMFEGMLNLGSLCVISFPPPSGK